mmetsp:Transcript_20865/g.34912  ORF Transcript_20865/g.34912 Transcript_20865/m.34912 type:complete len:310 (-) Transcript_20865:103-1032(-)|eukprot:CAMPEP_0198201962 /NCGR_PEP_ID=MMETSP1445-20131203/4995_1 /TAXON_ID=36898 /ORGANISM="Pyramimonas sp., Strain CCMP2087" /LENGTH=309 /DNA_ID=CAMNT_0043872639 /DNA_START=144 /DNA_END=1073 /DNA_ORIENTATION=-
MEGSAPPTEVAASPVELPAPPAGVISIEVDGAGEGVTVAPMTADEEAMMADFFKEVDNAKRDGEVMRIVSCFKLNPYEHLNLKFDATVEDVKRSYRQVSLMVHPDKNKHPRAKDAFAALGKAAEWLQDDDRKRDLHASLNHARELLRKERKKEVKADVALAAQIRLMTANGVLPDYELTPDFHARWKQKSREILTEIEWRRRKMTLRIKDEEGRIKISEAEDKKTRNAEKRERQGWEERRNERVGSWRDFQKNAKAKKGGKAIGELKPPKLKEYDAEKSYVQRPSAKGEDNSIPGTTAGNKPNKHRRAF